MTRGLELGELEQTVLLAVWQLRDESAYTVSVRDELRRRAGRRLSLSTVYLTLVRLEEKTALSSSMGAPTAVRGGKAKRCFRITAKGIDALRRARGRMNRMWEGLEGPPLRSMGRTP